MEGVSSGVIADMWLDDALTGLTPYRLLQPVRLRADQCTFTRDVVNLYTNSEPHEPAAALCKVESAVVRHLLLLSFVNVVTHSVDK